MKIKIDYQSWVAAIILLASMPFLGKEGRWEWLYWLGNLIVYILITNSSFKENSEDYMSLLEEEQKIKELESRIKNLENIIK
ncbi:hypothetical protein [Pantanalinema sp. GBBB05]|uniref:hypothetical protein n=1 Tax=Pantanalinema sp. GBBB05 TaxID=2604139 RepID=UPI001D4BE06F|nr:hypothetical protein [Pantanalinema sp. GBBB05]